MIFSLFFLSDMLQLAVLNACFYQGNEVLQYIMVLRIGASRSSLVWTQKVNMAY